MCHIEETRSIFKIRLGIVRVILEAKKKENKVMREHVKQVLKEKREVWKEFCQEEDGVGILEVILILVILIGLVLLFKENITEIVENAFKEINNDSKSIIN